MMLSVILSRLICFCKRLHEFGRFLPALYTVHQISMRIVYDELCVI